MRKGGVFRDRPTQRDDVLAFYGNGATVPPLAFSAIIRDMKALLTMPEGPTRTNGGQSGGRQFREALERLDQIVLDGLRHGHFRCAISGSIGEGNRREIVIAAGKSHKFMIPRKNYRADAADSGDPCDGDARRNHIQVQCHRWDSGTGGQRHGAARSREPDALNGVELPGPFVDLPLTTTRSPAGSPAGPALPAGQKLHKVVETRLIELSQ